MGGGNGLHNFKKKLRKGRLGGYAKMGEDLISLFAFGGKNGGGREGGSNPVTAGPQVTLLQHE